LGRGRELGPDLTQRYRQDRQTGQRSDSLGRTVLQTVAQKPVKSCAEVL